MVAWPHDQTRIFNSLPRSIANLKNEKAKFIVTLKKYQNAHSFYSVDEFLASADDLKRWLIRSYKTV
jgi:phosphodiesterase/alkaline phosphatase D-like protein